MERFLSMHEKDWLSTVEKLAPIGSQETAWVRVESKNSWNLPAMPCQILVDERVLYFRLPPKERQDVPQIEIEFYLPDEGATFSKREDEHGETRLVMECLVKWHQNQHQQPFRLIIATTMEFLGLSDSEVHIQ